MRVLYAHETRRSAPCTDLEFVDQGLSSQSENAQTARFKEPAECGTGRMPSTQEKMRLLIDRKGGIENIAAQPKPIELTRRCRLLNPDPTPRVGIPTHKRTTMMDAFVSG